MKNYLYCNTRSSFYAIIYSIRIPVKDGDDSRIQGLIYGNYGFKHIEDHPCSESPSLLSKKLPLEVKMLNVRLLL